MILSPVMQDVLVSMLEWEWTPDYTSPTMRALERRDLAQWYPYAKRDCFVGVWKLTAKGKKIAKELVQHAASA